MSVYKLIPSHYVKLHHEGPRPLPAPPCSVDQFENLKLLLHTSNSKLASLATTIRDLREQLRDRDATIAELTAAVATRTTTTTTTSTMVHNRVEVSRRVEPQDVVVDVTSDIQVRLKVELVDQGPGRKPLVQVASTVVSRRPAVGAAPRATASPAPVPEEAVTKRSDDVPDGPPAGLYTSRSTSAGPGPMRPGHLVGAGGPHLGALGASPLYASLMWRTRQRAKELGYRFVWSRYGKILVKKDVQSPSMYILDEADLRKMG